MNTATILKTPQEQVKDIQNYDRNILVETLITSPKDLQDSVNFFESLKNLPGANVTLLNNLQQDCMQIMIEKIKLTKTVLGVTGNTHTIIPNPQLELNLEDTKEVKESKVETVINAEEIQAQTEVKDNKVKFEDFNQKGKKAEAKVINKDVDKVKAEKREGFKGYTRKVIFGTETPLSKDVQKLLAAAKSESDIDNIARHLVEEGKVEEALNMSIDLFEKSETVKKSQQEVEKRFLNEILPWCHGVTTTPFDSFQNITLAFWNKHLIEIALSSRLISEITDLATEEMKAGLITAKTAIKIKTEFPNDSDKIFADVCKNVGISHVKIESAPMVTIPKDEKTTKEVVTEPVVTVGLTYEALQNECLNMFKANPDSKTIFKEVKDFFTKEVANVVDEEFDKTDTGLFAKIVIEFKKSQKTVDEAEKAAYDGKDTIPETTITESRSIVKQALESGKSVVNQLRIYFSKKENRNVLGKTKVEVFAKKIEEEVKAANPELKEASKEKKILLKNFNVEEKHPDVWESAKLCKTQEEFKDLLIAIVFDKIKELGGDNSWHVAANLANQYMNKIEGCSALNDVDKLAFFHGVVNATNIERKKAKKDAAVTDVEVIEEATVVEEVKETPIVEETTKQEDIEMQRTEEPAKEATPAVETPTSTETAPQAVDMKKFDGIMQLSNREKIDALIVEFLLLTEYKTYSERFNELRDKYLKGNKKWSGSKPDQRENTINKIVKENPAIQALTK